MKIIEADKTYAKSWDEFLKIKNQCFLQSWAWGIFQESLGRSVWRLAVVDDAGAILLACLLIKMPLLFKYHYLYSPRLQLTSDWQAQELLMQKITTIAKDQKSVFCRLEFHEQLTPPQKNLLTQYKFEKISKTVQPPATLMMDILPEQEKLLAAMHPKTRYNIKLAQKKGIKIVFSNDEKEVVRFLNLVKKTAQRKEFGIHRANYYQQLLIAAGFELVFAVYQDKMIAANLVKFFGPTMVYVHGASDYAYHQLMAPYLLQWAGILEAKRRGCHFYDFWGVVEKGDSDSAWAGFSRFKFGFSPQTEIIRYEGVYQRVFAPSLFLAYKILSKLKKMV